VQSTGVAGSAFNIPGSKGRLINRIDINSVRYIFSTDSGIY